MEACGNIQKLPADDVTCTPSITGMHCSWYGKQRKTGRGRYQGAREWLDLVWSVCDACTCVPAGKLKVQTRKELPLLFRTRLLLEVKALPQHVQTKGMTVAVM